MKQRRFQLMDSKIAIVGPFSLCATSKSVVASEIIGMRLEASCRIIYLRMNGMFVNDEVVVSGISEHACCCIQHLSIGGRKPLHETIPQGLQEIVV